MNNTLIHQDCIDATLRVLQKAAYVQPGYICLAAAQGIGRR